MNVMNAYRFALIAALLWAGASPLASAQQQSPWQWSNPLPNDNFKTRVIWDGSQFVAVDIGGLIDTSPDGIDWRSTASGSLFLHAIAAGGGQYVAVGLDGGIQTSTDTVNWQTRSSPISEPLWAVIWADDGAGGQFVAVGGTWDGTPDGGDGVVVTSPDGITWTQQSVPATVTTSLDAVTWDGQRFVAAGYYGTVLTSTDAVTWTVQSSGSDERLISLASGAGTVVATGQSGSILTSPDGVAWSVARMPDGSSIDDVKWTGTQFVAVGVTFGSAWSGFVLTSPDGTTWTPQESGTNDELYTVAASADTIVALGEGEGTIISSGDGVTWTTRSSRVTSEALIAVAWTGDRFITIGDGGSVLLSTDGKSWDVLPAVLPFYPTDVTWGGDRFVAVGYGGEIATSTDGAVWSPQDSTTSADIYGVTWGDNQFVAVGTVPPTMIGGSSHAVILTSPDGVAWTIQDSQTVDGDSLLAVTWGGNQFVAVGGGPTVIFTSPDGQNWTRRQLAPGRGPYLSSVTWNGSLYVAVGSVFEIPIDPRVIATSPDGVDWTFQTPPVDNVGYVTALTSVVWSQGQFVAVGGFGIELHSYDGIIWFSGFTGSLVEFSDIATDGRTCVAVGIDGGILTNPTCGIDRIFANSFEGR